MDSEKKRSDEYWMGVRDALRMVDSFIKWARRNEDRAKTLDDFIHDGLIAAAKRCESCLKDDLGLTFAEGQEKATEPSEPEQIPSGYEMGSTLSIPSEESFEMTPEDMSPDSTEVPIESEEESVSIDTVGRLEDEEIEDFSIEGPAREFSSDFDLVEPTEFPASDSDAEISSTSESEVDKEPEEDSDHAPSFTWADYERAITPSEEEPEDSEEDEDVELPPPVVLGTTPDKSEETLVPVPPELPPDDLKDSQSDEEETDSDEASEAPTRPPPPPPPEDEEDEEERRRRARRLFFGD